MASNRGLRNRLNSSAIGMRSRACSSAGCFSSFSCAAWKVGVSVSLNRMNRPTAMSTALSRNGMRQPQLISASSGSVDTIAKMPVESTSPTALPICGKLP